MTSENKQYDYFQKLIVIGDSGVGKTCTLLRFCENIFQETTLATIGVDFKLKNMNINNKRIKMQIWDSAGQEKYKTVTTNYYKGS